MYRGLIHFHSKYSYDSIVSINSIIDFAKKNRLNFLVLTDHDTIKGSKVLKKEINKRDLNIEVLVAAEYKTEYGDLIALNIRQELKNMKFEAFVNDVKEQGGLILFPHPYLGHKNIEQIASASDLIEVFNSRVSDEFNDKAMDLAIKFNKKIYHSGDAHNKFSLKNTIVEFKKDGDLINSLKNSSIKKRSQIKTFQFEIYLSQIVKGIKCRHALLIWINFLAIVKLILKLQLFRKC
jgi:predicted metal-dependent phosphoesterase TrpH